MPAATDAGSTPEIIPEMNSGSTINGRAKALNLEKGYIDKAALRHEHNQAAFEHHPNRAFDLVADAYSSLAHDAHLARIKAEKELEKAMKALEALEKEASELKKKVAALEKKVGGT